MATMFRTQGIPAGQNSMRLSLRCPVDEPPEPAPKAETAYDAAQQAREMANLVKAMARAYGYHIPMRVAGECARLITRDEHRYDFGEFDEPTGGQ